MALQPVEIYRYALDAGFSPDQAVTMTAIALAESGGNPQAHNPVGEDSIGLWQVNREAHPRFAGADGTDPLTNARMAYEVSGGGTDIGRWTVTHADKGAPYLNYRAQAEAAAAAAGHPDAVGQWDPPLNYHSPKVGAGPGGDGPPPEPPAGFEGGAAGEVPPVDPPVAVAPAPGPPPLDSDGDGLVDDYERLIGTDPFSADTDRDGFDDGQEVLHGTDPRAFADNPLVGTGEGPGFAVPLTTESPGPGALAPAPVSPSPAAPPPAPPAPAAAPAADLAPAAGDQTGLDVFIEAALSQDGADYIFGEDEDPNDPDPMSDGDASYDCSSLIRWAAAQAGVDFTNGSWLQYLTIQEQGTELTVEEAMRTPGALVFNFSSEPVPGGERPSSAHVAISLGDGRLMEARGQAYGVGVFDADGREFSHAGYIPDLGLDLGADVLDLEGNVLADPLPMVVGSDLTEPVDIDLPAIGLSGVGLLDADGDGLIDDYERLIGTDPFSADTDRDGFLDGAELVYGSDPLDLTDNLLVAGGEASGFDVPLAGVDDGLTDDAGDLDLAGG